MAAKPLRWRSPIAGLLIFLFGAPLVNLGVINLIENEAKVRETMNQSQSLLALGLGLSVLALSFWLLNIQSRLDALTGWPRKLQFMEYTSFLLICLGMGLGMTSMSGAFLTQVYFLLLLTGLGLGFLFVLGRITQRSQQLRQIYKNRKP